MLVNQYKVICGKCGSVRAVLNVRPNERFWFDPNTYPSLACCKKKVSDCKMCGGWNFFLNIQVESVEIPDPKEDEIHMAEDEP